MISINENPLNTTVFDEFVSDVSATNSSAFYFLTVYPDAWVTDSNAVLFAQEVSKMVASGSSIMIRFAPEMNGNWFFYGQQPTVYKSEWIKFVTAIRTATAQYSKQVAFLWSPNTGMGYPFPHDNNPVAAKDKAADTNGDGILTPADDPYSPYYPGDEWVDWVGMSIYSYSSDSAVSNDIPWPGKLENYMNGYENANMKTPFNFYNMFSRTGAGTSPASKGGKPYFLSETGAAVMSEVCSAVDAVGNCLATASWKPVAGADAQHASDMHAGWWRQFINRTFLQTYPQFKGACFFEIAKIEGNTVRDFASLGMGMPDFVSPLGKQVQAQDGTTLDTFLGDMAGPLGSLVQWANPPGTVAGSTPDTSGSVPKPSAATATTTPQANSAAALTLAHLAMLVALQLAMTV
ncbi:hypothetical protein HDU91_005726 [Kappamyces sp. JEL0680]|nr:hypothetical protein HDU91_005726 [Kappamyces sp. JEL0680]